MNIQNKTIVVTGAGGGIGSALVRELLHRGARVAAVDLRDESLQALKSSLSDAEKLSTHPLDITNREAVLALPAQVAETHGAVDGLINCAGIIQPFVKVQDVDYAAIERVMNINFYGTLNMTKAFLPTLLARPEAYVMNVSSMGGFLPVPGQSVYGASKAAVKLLSEALYAELLDTSVHVSVVFPGATQTDITKNSGVAAPVAPGDMKNYKSLTADAAARLMLDGMERNKVQIYTGSDSKFMRQLYRFAPVFATRFIAKKMKNLLP